MAEGTTLEREVEAATSVGAAPAAAAAAGAGEEMVTVVNQGRGDVVILPMKPGQILPDKSVTLLKNSGNTLVVPRSVADRVMRHNKFVKDARSIFPDAPDLAKLQAENAALRGQASALEKLLNGADLDKKAAANAAAADKKTLEQDIVKANERIIDLGKRLQSFIDADKKDLPALQKEHADAVAASPTAAGQP